MVGTREGWAWKGGAWKWWGHGKDGGMGAVGAWQGWDMEGWSTEMLATWKRWGTGAVGHGRVGTWEGWGHGSSGGMGGVGAWEGRSGVVLLVFVLACTFYVSFNQTTKDESVDLSPQ